MTTFTALQLGAGARAPLVAGAVPASRAAPRAAAQPQIATEAPAATPLIAVAAVGAALAGRVLGGSKGRSKASFARRGTTRAAMHAKKVFIDGEAGTTGLQVYERLAAHPDIEILSLPSELRKDEDARREALQTADAAVLCLPDDAARAAVELVGDADTVIVDASTAHRTADGWTYGFAEMAPGQAEKIAASKRIANPGCYPTGFIGLMRPLVDAGLVPPETLATIHAISGYSGGGKGLIEIYEGQEHEPWGAYGFSLAHKHTPEMSKWTGLLDEPIFCPAVAGFKQGMVVSVPLRKSQLAPGATAADLHEALSKHYAGKHFVKVMPLNDTDSLERGAFLRPDTLNNTNCLELFVFGNEEKGTLWLAARLDNLGKGASGACVQNLNIALGFDQTAGLSG